MFIFGLSKTNAQNIVIQPDYCLFISCQDSVFKHYIKYYDSCTNEFETNNLGNNKYFWGVQDSNVVYRLFNDIYYKIEDTSGLIIYSRNSIKNEISFYFWVISDYPFIEESYISKEYYFSLNYCDSICNLTIKNLELRVQCVDFIEKANRKFKWYKYDLNERFKSGQFIVNKLFNEFRCNR